MKKIVLIFFVIFVGLQTSAQKTVYGTYKGKSVKLVYYEGDPDIIKSIEYQAVTDLEKENSNLQAQIAAKNKKINELQSAVGGPVANKAQTDSLKREIGILKTDKDKLSADIKTNNTEINKLNTSLLHLKDSLTLANSEKNRLSLKASELQTKSTDLEKQIIEKNNKIKELQAAAGKTDENKKQIDALNKEIEKLQTDKDKLSAEIKTNNIEINKLKGSIQPLNDSLTQANLEKKRIALKASELETKNTDLENQIIEKNKKIKELQGATAKPGENKEQIDALNKEIEKLQTDKDKLSAEIKTNNIEINKLKGSIQPLNDSLAKSNAEKKRIALKASELEAKNANLENQIVEKNKKIKELQGAAGKPGENKEQTDALNKEIEKLQTEKNQLTAEIDNNNIEINKLKESVTPLNASLDQANKEIKRLEEKLKRQAEDNYKSAPSLAVSYAAGIPFLFSNLMKSGIWDKSHPVSSQFSLIYEQPLGHVSLGIGLGISDYKFKATFSNFEETLEGLTDIDNDRYNAICSYNDVKENVSLLYLDIPVVLSVGQPRVHRIGAYCKIGITASINLQNKFKGEGKYNISGYYPEWDVVIHDVDELNFRSDASCYEDADYKVNKLVLWGNLSGGVYLPLSKIKAGKDARYILKLGARCDYTLNTISKQLTELYSGATYHIKQSNILSGKGTRILSPGFEIAVIFMLAKPK